MAKELDLSKSVYALTKQYPELIGILEKLGFNEITKKGRLITVGKIMTIPKGAKAKDIPMAKVVVTLMNEGFMLTRKMPQNDSFTLEADPKEAPVEKKNSKEARIEKLKAYLRRLGEGEDLEDVQKDFVQEFGDVEASEIMQAEQELMEEGTPLSEVQKLCDLHSALFHGATREERIANTEKEVMASVYRKREQEEMEKLQSSEKYSDKDLKAQELEGIVGHPLYTFTEENKQFENLLSAYKESQDGSLLSSIREISIHYAKKGDLLYPLLKVKYGISGPSEVMWTVDDEIRDELNKLSKLENRDEIWKARLEKVLTRAEEMVYKEQNILFPICAVNFSDEDWYGLYRDSKDYAPCFGVENEIWEEAEKASSGKANPSLNSGEVMMPGGHMSVEQVTALLNTVPLEISFVDDKDINRFFNEGHKVFKRPMAALGREVYTCHPPKIEPMVRQIISDFKNNKRNEISIWMEKNGRTYLVRYTAVRDRNGKYVGTAEFVQDMEFAKEHFLKAKVSD